VKILLVVAAALMNEKGEVLLAERPEGKQLAGHFEFPGGKIEAGELPEAALIRELKEELGIDVDASALEPLTFLSHSYPEFGFHLLMPTWLIRVWRGTPQALEHKSLKFVRPKDMHEYLMIEADKPLVTRLMELEV
jgi:8-oxo-dGTP diphosphatase